MIDRRLLLAGGLAALPGFALAATPPGRRLAFQVLRNGTLIGEHRMSFAGDPASPTVTTDVRMTVKLGPVPVFRYRHHAVERWTGGRFASLDTTTDSNGKAERVSARRTEAGVIIETAKGRITGPAGVRPFTHWNPEVFSGPLFNPQEGKLLKVTTRKVSATQWAVRGEAEIDDFYDETGVWAALKGKLEDGSRIEYRRL
ncbi:DUF6134 family protein [Phenylobacterium sp.]|uniref:DUF6134 family protein n=1 Tax=Phenylobacterium sp. TaxID=1871053 RepID=UPI0030F4A9F0